MKNISIAGELGSGKSTVSNYLITKIDYKIFSAGILFREMAKQHGMTPKEFNVFIENDPHYDNFVDDTIIKKGKEESNIIFDSRMAWHFVPGSFKIYLYVDVDTAAERIMNDTKRVNETYKDLATARQNIIERRQSEVLRYSYFNYVDVNDKRNFDLIIDTSSADREQIIELVLKSFQAFNEGMDYNKIWLAPKSLNLLDDTSESKDGMLKVIKYNNSFYVYEGREIVEKANEENKTLLSVSVLYQEGDVLPNGIEVKDFVK